MLMEHFEGPILPGVEKKKLFTNGSFKYPFRADSGCLSYINNVGTEPLIYQTIPQLLDDAARRYPDRPAIIACFENKTLTFRQVLQETEIIAAGLLNLGLRRGDKIALLGPNSLDWYLTLMATTKIGLIAVLLNPAFQADEIAYCLKKAEVTAVITKDEFKTQKYYDILNKIVPEIAVSEPGKINSVEIPSLKTVVMMSDKKYPGAYTLNQISEMVNEEMILRLREVESELMPDDPFNIQFTSGTTGRPKATLLSHFQYVNNAYLVGKRNELHSKHHKICVNVPFFHAFGVLLTCVLGVEFGATLVVGGLSFRADDALKAINTHKCTVIHGTPTMYIDMIRKQEEMKCEMFSPDLALTGGAPCSPELFKSIRNVLKVKKVKSVFGMTETSAVIFQSLSSDSVDVISTTVGYIQEHVEAKVIDQNGRTVPFGCPGELCVRGYMNMLCYLNDEGKTKEMIGTDGWLKTGDQFILLKNGYGKIVGRLKEMIIRGGENIFPKEIEFFLSTHPDIEENYVVGVNDERMGEEIGVCIKLKEGTALTYEELRAFCKGKISHFKIPRYMKLVTSFPKTMSGKVQKFKLREMVEKELNL